MRISFPSIAHIYRDPRDKQELRESTSGWIALDGRKYPTTSAYGQSIPIFTDLDTEYASASDAMYNTRQAAEVYRNFLNWLFATFEVDEASFRQSLVSKLHLKPGDRLLITGCGLGDDVIPVVNTFGPEVQVFALDLSTAMVSHAAEALGNLGVLRNGVVNLSVADACELPFADGTFDAVFHFGGINLFSDPKRGIFEMTRVVKEGGRVVFGDEGVAPWLKGTHYARMVIANNPLWEADSLISQLPFSAVNVNISWILGNCFYLIEYDKRADGPLINTDVQHLGYKGGTMRTRYLGRIEGISPLLKDRLYTYAKSHSRSVHDVLEAAIESELTRLNALGKNSD